MERNDFERTLREGKYTPVSRDIEPGYAIDDHDHAWDTRGLVLRGSFTIACDGDSRTYEPGEIFELAAGVTHTEHAGPDGAALLVGRRKVEDR